VEAGPWSAGHDDWLMRQIYEPSIQAFKDTGGLAVQYGWRDFGDRMRGGWCNVDPSGFKIPCFYNHTPLRAHPWFLPYPPPLRPRRRHLRRDAPPLLHGHRRLPPPTKGPLAA